MAKKVLSIYCGFTPLHAGEFLLLWQLQNINVDAVIVGPKTEPQLSELVRLVKNIKADKIVEFKDQVITAANENELGIQFFDSIFKS